MSASLAAALGPEACRLVLMPALDHFVGKALGERYCERLPSLVSQIYDDSSPATPLLFILTSGADPHALVTRFAAECGFESRVQSTSPRARDDDFNRSRAAEAPLSH